MAMPKGLLKEVNDRTIRVETKLDYFLQVYEHRQEENKEAHEKMEKDYNGKFRAFWVALGTLVVSVFLAFINQSTGSPR